MYDIFFAPVHEILNLKKTTSAALKRLGIELIRDLVFYRPYYYKEIAQEPKLSAEFIDKEIIKTVIVKEIRRGTGKSPTKIFTQDSNNTGLILIFFNKIPPFIYSKIQIGKAITLAGKLQNIAGNWQLSHPEFIMSKMLIVPIMPVYHLTYAITNKQLYSYILAAINRLELQYNQLNNAHHTKFAQEILKHLRQIHCPAANNFDSIEQSIKALAYLELFANQIKIQRLRFAKDININASKAPAYNKIQELLNHIGFELTSGQVEALKEIQQDMMQPKQMMRMLQGDVGCGKTLVALLATVSAFANKYQTCIMAPTDLLSNQHYQFFKTSLAFLGTNVALLTGKTSVKERRIIDADLQSGKVDVLIGTHALFQDDVKFCKLGLVVIDEQHRFGVEQRLKLINKADAPDVLVMTATPIPRSLALTIYGDMDVSKILTKPKSRLPIITKTTSDENRQEIMYSLARILGLGQKIYWVCPLIDQSQKISTNEDEANNEDTAIPGKGQFANVTDTAKQLEKIYPNNILTLHGKMRPSEKDIIMQQFKDADNGILVATTVIEVGIDVPEATLIVIENAERFGLAQLHQLRGRVGRGNKQSYCILLYNKKTLSKTGKARLSALKDSNDGFYLSEQDLKLRGGGEFLGTKQSGEPVFYFASLSENLPELTKAAECADSYLRAAKKDHAQQEKIDFQVQLFNNKSDEMLKSG